MDCLLGEASDLPAGLSWACSRRYNWEGIGGCCLLPWGVGLRATFA